MVRLSDQLREHVIIFLFWSLVGEVPFLLLQGKSCEFLQQNDHICLLFEFKNGPKVPTHSRVQGTDL
jgi:hypothetical protein